MKVIIKKQNSWILYFLSSFSKITFFFKDAKLYSQSINQSTVSKSLIQPDQTKILPTQLTKTEKAIFFIENTEEYFYNWVHDN